MNKLGDDASLADRWEPPDTGGDFYYRVTMDLERRQPIELSASVPDMDLIEMSSARVTRIGGASPRDWRYRRSLYYYVGLITVAGGKVEAAMKRAILVGKATREGQFALVDETWTGLEKRLRNTAKQHLTASEVAIGWGQAVLTTLDWGRENRAKERRDSAVHAYWWDFADVEWMRGRFPRTGEEALWVGEAEGLRRDSQVLLEFAERLESLSGPHWLNLYLPREVPEDKERGSFIEWIPVQRSDDSATGERAEEH